MLLTVCVFIPLLIIPQTSGNAPEASATAESQNPSSSEEGQSCKDLGLYQPVYVEFAEVLSQYYPQSELEELLDLAQFIVEKSHENGLNPYLVLAVIRVESTFNPCAISRKGAKGLMQVIPAYILGREKVNREYAFSHHRFFDPYENIGMGVGYLASLVTRFGSVETAVAAYNMGPTRLSRRLRQEQGPISTRYSRKVIHQFENFKSLNQTAMAL